VKVPPFKKGEDLMDHLGLVSASLKDVAAFLGDKLVDGRVVPLIENPTVYKDIAYLDPLLEKHPPSDIRAVGLIETLFGPDLRKYIDEGENAFRGKVPEGWRREAMERLGRQSHAPPHRFPAMCYAFLKASGYDPMVHAIERCLEKSPEAAVHLSVLYYMFLIRPFTLGLCGSPQYDQRFSSVAALIGIDLPKSTVFPLEVGKVIADYYDLGFLAEPDERAADLIYREKSVEKARALLEAFDAKVREGQVNDAIRTSTEIRQALLEASEAIPTIDKQFERMKYITGVARVGFTGIAALHPDINVRFLGLLANFGYTVLQPAIEESLAPRALALKFGLLPTTVWDFEKGYKEVGQYRRFLRERRERSE